MCDAMLLTVFHVALSVILGDCDLWLYSSKVFYKSYLKHLSVLSASGEQRNILYITDKIMALPSLTIDMCFKSLFLQAFEKLPITQRTFGYVIEANGMFREYIEFQLADNGENHIIWSRLCTSRGDATQDAARSAVLFLKERFKFEVRDINWAEMHHYQWCYEELDRDHDRLLEENRAMKTKITEYEDILLIIDGVDIIGSPSRDKTSSSVVQVNMF